MDFTPAARPFRHAVAADNGVHCADLLDLADRVAVLLQGCRRIAGVDFQKDAAAFMIESRPGDAVFKAEAALQRIDEC